jgi:hypothetical protein
MLEKSIIDASRPIRELLKRTGVHDFAVQGQGPDEKAMVPTTLIGVRDGGLVDLEVASSLYRPETKKGDPRMWVGSLREYSSAGDALSLCVLSNKHLVVVNLSDLASEALWQKALDEIHARGGTDALRGNPPLARLIDALRKIAGGPPLKSVKFGDTAVGMTIEHALGIVPNPSKMPDWEGVIELKARRPHASKSQTLFGQVPEWSLSPLKSSQEIMHEFGYINRSKHPDGLRRLNVTVNHQPNPQGLYLSPNFADSLVEERSTKPALPLVAVWSFGLLQQRLNDKHHETCWIECKVSMEGGIEHFLPEKVTYTRGPRADLFPYLVKSGDITLDHSTTEGRREHGPLWKVKRGAREILLPQVGETFLL